MPGRGSMLDRDDHRKLNRLITAVESVADELERLNENLESENSDG